MSGISCSFAGATYAPSLPTVPGQAYGGGYYAGQIGVSGVATHYLIVSPAASGQSSKQWSTSNQGFTGQASVIDGPTNTANMNDASHPAAYFCKGLTIGGFSDWYMPAANELDVCYYNLKPTTNSNDTNYGINANSIPRRTSNNTSGTPAQTSAALFQSGGGEEFQTNNWSSTQYTAPPDNYVRIQNFLTGKQDGIRMTYSIYVRAVRRIPV